MRSRAAAFTAITLLIISQGCSNNSDSGPTGPGDQEGPAILTQITFGPYYDVDPQWSPDGRTLAYVSDRSGVRTIWLLPDTAEATPLLGGGNNGDPQWSPDGDWIAFTSLLDGGHNRNIWKIPSTGGAPVQITHDTTDVSPPRWSPDGLRIAYISHFNGIIDDSTNEAMPPDLWVVSADGGIPEQITSGLDLRNPRWSPDGRKIAFVVGGGRGGIYTIDAIGKSRPVPLFLGSIVDTVTADTTDTGSLRWSPDGTRIAFTWMRSGHRQIGIVPSTGGTPISPITSPSNQAGPEWSPDGNRIVFLSEINGMSDIFVAPSAGGAADRMTFTALWDDFSPQWSPDGRKIAYVSQTSGDANIWLATFK